MSENVSSARVIRWIANPWGGWEIPVVEVYCACGARMSGDAFRLDPIDDSGRGGARREYVASGSCIRCRSHIWAKVRGDWSPVVRGSSDPREWRILDVCEELHLAAQPGASEHVIARREMLAAWLRSHLPPNGSSYDDLFRQLCLTALAEADFAE